MALVFVAAGGTKLGGAASMVALFEAVGVGQWLRYTVGSLEVVGGVLLAFPSVAGAAALGLIPLMIGATMTEVVISRHVPLAPSAALAALMAIAWCHRHDTRRMLRRGTGR